MKNNDDDLEEIELNEEPVGPTTAELCKQWFIELCNDINVKKYYNSGYNRYTFGSEENRFDYPFITKYNHTYTIYYKDYTSSLSKEDGENLLILFSKSDDAYYNNIFKSKLDYIEMSKRREKLYKIGSVIQIEHPSYGGKSR